MSFADNLKKLPGISHLAAINLLDADGNPMVDDSGNKIMDSEGVWFKNQDEFVVSVAPSFKMSENWSYGSILNFRSQFVNGYKSRTEQKKEHLKSKFMTPGYLDISLGITYKSPQKKFPIDRKSVV